MPIKKGRNYKITSELKKLIESKLCERWSPEQIVGRELKGKLSFKTIYNWLYEEVKTKEILDIGS